MSSEPESFDDRGPQEGGPLVIAYGNELRGDDGAAHYAARLIQETGRSGVRVLQCHQLTPELAEIVAAHEPVVFIDARRPDGRAEVEVQEVEPDRTLLGLGHAVSPQYVLALSAGLYGRAPRTWLVTIPTESMGFGGELSRVAELGAVTAADLTLQLIEKRTR